MQHTFLYISLRLFCTTKTWNFFATHHFFEELLYVITKNFVACAPVRFVFTAAHFHLAGRQYFSFSHRRYEIFMFFFQRNSSPYFSITSFSFFPVTHLSVDIKNNVEKTRPLSKSPGGHAISCQIKPWVAFRLPACWLNYFTLVYLWCRRTGGRADKRSRD